MNNKYGSLGLYLPSVLEIVESFACIQRHFGHLLQSSNISCPSAYQSSAVLNSSHSEPPAPWWWTSIENKCISWTPERLELTNTRWVLWCLSPPSHWTRQCPQICALVLRQKQTTCLPISSWTRNKTQLHCVTYTKWKECRPLDELEVWRRQNYLMIWTIIQFRNYTNGYNLFIVPSSPV